MTDIEPSDQVATAPSSSNSAVRRPGYRLTASAMRSRSSGKKTESEVSRIAALL
ncbi:hypothetical protein [Aeromicrobium sp. UC242_57]|uniref:hypothetical protein n=1 Tax=Aeromicrobium sp. UC242_57 TaxID=3374624 RepID=UPI0037AEA2BF